MPLLTLTTTGASDRSSKGRNAFVTRTMLTTFVSKMSKASSPVSSPAEARSANKYIDRAESLAGDLLPGNQSASVMSADTLVS